MLLKQHVLRNLRKNKDIVKTKPNKANGVVILDQKIYDNAIQEKIFGTSEFEKFNEDPTLKGEASLQCFLCTLKQKHFYNEKEYDKLYPPGSTAACIYATAKLNNFFSSNIYYTSSNCFIYR